MGTFLRHSLYPYYYVAKLSPPSYCAPVGDPQTGGRSDIVNAGFQVGEGQCNVKKLWPETFSHFPCSSTYQLGNLCKLLYLCEPQFPPL